MKWPEVPEMIFFPTYGNAGRDVHTFVSLHLLDGIRKSREGEIGNGFADARCVVNY